MHSDEDLTTIDFKFEFLKILCESEFFVALNIPTKESITSLEVIAGDFGSTHLALVNSDN